MIQIIESWFTMHSFAQVTSEDKPIILSISYSTCQWCYVRI
ncbi:DUF255 domain-containing protein [Ruminiclostridium papyrosolvens]